ncbi:hypothetical protein D3C71_1567720 [compost metagenome]
MPDIEVMFEEPDFEIELIEVFPKDISANVPSNIKTIYFRVIGQVDVALIDIDSFKLVGTHITGDYNETSHGEVAGQFSIVSAADGTTYLLFTIDVPEGSVG